MAGFGSGPSGWLLQVYSILLDFATAEEGLVGSFFWSAVGRDMRDIDGYCVFLEPPNASQKGISDGTCSTREPVQTTHEKRESPSADRSSELAGEPAQVSNAEDAQIQREGEIQEEAGEMGETEGEIEETCEAAAKSSKGEGSRSEEKEQQVAQKLEMKPARNPGWPDREVVRVIKRHAAEMTSLSGGWGNCSFM